MARPTDIDVTIHVRSGGQDIPGFEGGLRIRLPVEATATINKLIPANTAAGASPAADSIDVSQVTAITVDKPIVIYTGDNHIDGANLGAGGVLLILGYSGIPGGFHLANLSGMEDGDEGYSARLQGIVGGSSLAPSE